jgi:4-methylaminobutanoate oxidase (formaldehyde-forming)
VIQAADVIVIGAGAFGASTAFYLATMGKQVALIDKYEPVSQTSPRAAGLTGHLRGTDELTRLALRSIETIERFEAETGEPLVYEQPGSLKIARRPEHEEQLREEVARARRLGLEVDFISPREACRLNPFLRPEGIRAVTYARRDVYLEPGQIPRGYVRAAVRLGATLLANTSVTGIAIEGGAVQGVVTDRGEIRAPVVVDAAGAWTRQVAAGVGLRIPLVPTRHQLLISEPLPGVEPNQPITRIIDANVYVRPCEGGLMLGGYERDPVQYDIGALPPGFQIKDLPLDLGVLRRLADLVAEQLPVLRTIFDPPRIKEHRGGLPTMTADGRPLVGPLPGVRGFYVASGCCVGGLTTSPGNGWALADWIVRGEPSPDALPMAPARFGPEFADEAHLRAACYQRYANQYARH